MPLRCLRPTGLQYHMVLKSQPGSEPCQGREARDSKSHRQDLLPGQNIHYFNAFDEAGV